MSGTLALLHLYCHNLFMHCLLFVEPYFLLAV
jgi:hypothetical protein